MRNVIFSVLFLTVNICSAQDSVRRELSADEFSREIRKEGVQVLDVRTAAEFKTGHIKQALQADWNLQTQFRDRVQYLDKDQPVYVYCLVGGRSAAAADWLRQNGYRNVAELKGGINAWKAAGKSLEDAREEKQMSMADYQEKITKKDVVLVDFGASWCPPCIRMNAVLDSLDERKDLSFKLVRIDGGIHTTIMKELQAEPIPYFIIYKAGKETWRQQGIVTLEELARQLR